MSKKITVIGAGLAGVEAAYQLAKLNLSVDLYEMRPHKNTEVHTTGFFGELVCSNSLGSDQITSASGLLKEELKVFDSFFLKMADKFRVPAGRSFAVDRIKLAQAITREIDDIPHINIKNEEVTQLPKGLVIVATGPLTSPLLAEKLTRITLRKNLFFFDATSPIINSDSIDFEPTFLASRYNKGAADFINIPLNKEQYLGLVKDLIRAEKVEFKEFERRALFEACLPVEEIAERGEKALAFGPLKPVGLINPKTKQQPFAIVQLRQDDLNKRFYQMIGFQTRLKQNEQKKIFRKLPGLENARFERYGRMHRNTYVNAPLIIDEFLQCKQKPGLFFAGQICGVEGYNESIATGLLAGINAAKKLLGENMLNIPQETALGSLINYITRADWKNFKPTKFTFGLLPEISGKKVPKKEKKEIKAKRALHCLGEWKKKINI